MQTLIRILFMGIAIQSSVYAMMPLHSAARDGNIERMTTLLKDNVNVNNYVNLIDDRGRSALHYAAITGHCEAVKALIEAGAYVNRRYTLNDLMQQICPIIIQKSFEADFQVLVDFLIIFYEQDKVAMQAWQGPIYQAAIEAGRSVKKVFVDKIREYVENNSRRKAIQAKLAFAAILHHRCSDISTLVIQQPYLIQDILKHVQPIDFI